MTATPYPRLSPSRRARKLASAKARLADAHHQLMDLHMANLAELEEHPGGYGLDTVAMRELAELTDTLSRAYQQLRDEADRYADVRIGRVAR